MALNFSEIFLILVVILLVLGVGQLPAIAEMIGRARNGDGDRAVDVTPPRPAIDPGTRAPDAESIKGPVEDAELVDSSAS